MKQFPRGAALIFAVAACASAASTIHVPADQPTVQAGIDASANGDTILVSAGLYLENINFHGKAITVTSEQGATLTVIDGQALDSVVTFASAEGIGSVLRGFTLQNGSPALSGSGFGGGIRINFASPTIENNVISNNHGCIGSGISALAGSPVIQGNTLSYNGAPACGSGGGVGTITVQGGGAVQISNNIIEKNAITGISLFRAGSVTIGGNTIRLNTATAGLSPCAQGGGIWSTGESDPLIVNNLISGNSAGCGGGIYTDGSGALVVNNTIAGNIATQGSALYGGGFLAQTQLINNILASDGSAATLYCDGTASPSPPAVTSNDVFSSSSTAYGGICAGLGAANGNISIDPLFFGAASGDFRLASGSPAIDTGTAGGAPFLDIEGNPRPIDGDSNGIAAFDMGAYEALQAIVALPDLTASKIDSVGGTAAFPNPWNWSIAVSNHGGSPATFSVGQVILRDNLPANSLTYGAPSIASPSLVSGPGSLACTINFNDLICSATSGNVTIGAAGGFVVQFSAIPTTVGSVTNPRGPGTCAVDPDNVLAEANESNNNCSDTVLVPGPDVQLTEVVTSGSFNGQAIAGSNVTYLLTVLDNGSSAAANVVVTDNLPANTSFVSCTSNVGTCTNNLNVVTASFSSLPGRTQAQVTIVANIGSAVPGGTTIANTATVITSPPDPNPKNNTATAFLTIGVPADVQLTKVISAGVSGGMATAGSNVTYLITVLNNGPNTATNVAVTDFLPANTSFVSCVVSVGGCGQSQAVGASLGSLASGAQATVTIVAKVADSAAAGTVISNTASVAASTLDPNPGNNTAGPATFTVKARPPADVQLTKTISSGVSSGTAFAGTNVSYLLTATNSGPNTADNVLVTDTLPANATFVSCTSSVGTCFLDHLNPVTANIGSLAGGAQATVTLIVNIACSVPDGTVINNTASVTASNPDPNPANNTGGPVTFTVHPPPIIVNASVALNVFTQNNHDMLNPGLTASITQSTCTSPATTTVQIYGDEDDETPTAKNEVYSPDAANIAVGTLRLRAERVDSGDGRVYVIIVKASNTSGGTGFGAATVVVPKSTSASSLASAMSQAAAAVTFANAHNGAPPPGYFVIGDGPTIGPKQ